MTWPRCDIDDYAGCQERTQWIVNAHTRGTSLVRCFWGIRRPCLARPRSPTPRGRQTSSGLVASRCCRRVLGTWLMRFCGCSTSVQVGASTCCTGRERARSGGRCRRKSTQPSQLPAARRLRQAKGHGLIRPMGRRLDRGRCWPRSWPPSSRWIASDTGPWCDLLRAPPLEGCTLMTHSDARSTRPLRRTRCSTTCWQSDYVHLSLAHDTTKPMRADDPQIPPRARLVLHRRCLRPLGVGLLIEIVRPTRTGVDRCSSPRSTPRPACPAFWRVETGLWSRWSRYQRVDGAFAKAAG